MANLSPRLFLNLLLSTVTFIFFNQRQAIAQIIPDKTLGNENSTVRQDTIKNLPSDVIEGGATRGSNLFHSFQEFNVNQGRGGYFNNPEAIRNIFGRVTGNNASKIFGTLGVLGNANLYLINPNGIIFGKNARLDINGAFFGSTADSFVFDNNFEFSASNPSAPPLLTVDIPLGVRFRDNSNGDINSQANLATGGDLTLQGNNLNLSGSVVAEEDLTLTAQNDVTIRDSVDNPFVAFSGNDLLIEGSLVDIFALNNPNSTIFTNGNLTLKSPNAVIGDAYYWSGGNFRIEKTDGSLGQLNSPNDPVIRTLGDVFIGAYEGASLHIIAGGSVTIPDSIVITGADTEFGLQETITLSNGQTINIDGKNTPTVDIRAGVDPNFIGFPSIQKTGNDFLSPLTFLSEVSTSADIILGAVIFSENITDATKKITGNVLLTNQYKPNPNLQGSITLNPFGSSNPSFQLTAIDTSSFNSGGKITIDSKDGAIVLGAITSFASRQNGKGGDILFNTVGDISLINSNLIVTASQGGNINLNANNIDILNSTLSSGIRANLGLENTQGGNIELNANETILIDGSLIANGVLTNARGSAGDTIINTSNLILNSALINSNTAGFGNAGFINIRASEGIFVGGEHSIFGTSGISSQVQPTATGNSQGIKIFSKKLTVQDGANIDSSTFGNGNTGLVDITTTESLDIKGVSSLSPVVQQSLIGSQVQGEGNSQGIIINTPNLNLMNGGTIDSSTTGKGNAGIININSPNGNIVLNGNSPSGLVSSISSQIQGLETEGDSEGIVINTSKLNLENGGGIYGSTLAKGNAGSINITANNSITISGEDTIGRIVSGIFSDVGVFEEQIGRGDGGEIIISTSNLIIKNGGSISTSTFGQGSTGKIDITALDKITISGESSLGQVSSIASQVRQQAKGNSQGIIINTGILTLENGAGISASTAGEGNSGAISIKSTNNIIVTGESSNAQTSTILSTVADQGLGNSSGIDIETINLTLENGGLINASTFGKGESGKILIKATGDIILTGESSIAQTSRIVSIVADQGLKNSSGIDIETINLTLKNGGIVSASTFGKGDSGAILIRAKGDIMLTGKSSTNQISSIASGVGLTGVGNSDGIEIETSQLTLENGSTITASTFGEGKAGNIFINANEQVFLSGKSFDIFLNREVGGIFALTQTEGNAGSMVLNTPNLRLSNGASIEAFTSATGDAGNITINSPEIVNIDRDSSIVVTTSSTGNPGDININTNTLNLGQDAQLSATALEGSSNNEGGNINLNAQNLNIAGELGIFAETQSISDAGNLTIQPNDNNPTLNIDFTDNGFISASTTSTGNGGNITITAPETINLRGEGKISTETESSGNGGIIEIITNDRLNLQDGVTITASTTDTSTGNGGSIFINTPIDANLQPIDNNPQNSNLDINLNKKASITVNSDGKGNGGNIFITGENISLNDRSSISAETASQDGGNVTINIDRFIRQQNNSDISATAGERGDGGNVTLNAKFLIGRENSDITANAVEGTGGNIEITATGNFRDFASDITASSQFGQDGVVEINEPETDPGEGLIEFSSNVVDANDLIAQNVCRQGEKSEFTVRGKGGLPDSPEEYVSAEEIEVNTISPVADNSTPITENDRVSKSSEQGKRKIVPARGWVKNEKGELVLVAYANQDSANRTTNYNQGCSN